MLSLDGFHIIKRLSMKDLLLPARIDVRTSKMIII